MNAELRSLAFGEPSSQPERGDAPALPISDWNRDERPRERLLKLGAAALSDAELLAVFLRTGVPGATAVDVANSLLKRFGSLRRLLDASAPALQNERGVGEARAATLLAVSELCRRALAEKARETPLLGSPNAVEDFLRFKIGALRREVFVGLYLDARHQLVDIRDESQGTLTRVPVFPQEIARHALAVNAVAVIVAHNHPSGGVEPSLSDRKLTKTIQETLAVIDVKLLDHFVVSHNEICSFARQGWL
jgi:DNA repair protein RadC